MNITVRLAEDTDREQLINVFNYYVTNGFAAYSTKPIPPQVFDMLKSMCREGHFYVAVNSENNVIGFAMLKFYFNADCFAKTAEVGYFILPEYTNQGLGARLLNTLTQAAISIGIKVLTANVSSLNPESLAFHLKQGFTQCGRLVNVGEKFSRNFDVIWFQKSI